MLRRAATTIKLIPEDIHEFDQTISNNNNSYLKDDNLQEQDPEQEPDVSITNYKSRHERIINNETH